MMYKYLILPLMLGIISISKIDGRSIFVKENPCPSDQDSVEYLVTCGRDPQKLEDLLKSVPYNTPEYEQRKPILTTLLYKAIQFNNIQAVNLLVEYGASTTGNSHQEHPLATAIRACVRNLRIIAEILYSHGTINQNLKSTLEEYKEIGIDFSPLLRRYSHMGPADYSPFVIDARYKE